ncbi:scavenger receptor class B member 1 isoform X1 [Eptesicus fuscus]|uniref:scavenger receptor class B member 1 isoform X1 n=1 Tax=Eptesicus fuscus TaxID=29078 RepID=UPI00240412FA|nr:scavenger receptor class B member 1 isoform X1 [Eptesicus fuscus]
MGGRCRAGWAAAALGALGLLCAVLGAVMIVAVPPFIRQQVLKNVRVDPSSLTFNVWKDLPVPFYFSVYFFDVLNPSEVLRGRRPQVRELGPYVYREFRHKSNITFHDNDTVSFREFRSFRFQPHLSRGSEGDHVCMPNILVLSAAMMVEKRPMALKLLMTLAFSSLGQQAFMNRTVGEVMWGYDDPLISLIHKYLPGVFPFKGKFGLFAEFNNSDSGLFTVFTGVKDFSRVHLVDKWNGVSKVNYWHSDQCNMINGTSGQMWAPFMTPETSVEFYSPEACRSMKLVYQEAGVYEGIPTFRFKAPDTLFANGSVYPPNEGFCPCLQSGIQNLSTCRFNAPLFLSHPHFYNADPSLAEAVLGLHPSEKEHSLFLDVHPVTGIPMNCSVKMQISLYMKAVEGIGVPEIPRASPALRLSQPGSPAPAPRFFRTLSADSLPAPTSELHACDHTLHPPHLSVCSGVSHTLRDGDATEGTPGAARQRGLFWNLLSRAVMGVWASPGQWATGPQRPVHGPADTTARVGLTQQTGLIGPEAQPRRRLLVPKPVGGAQPLTRASEPAPHPAPHPHRTLASWGWVWGAPSLR